MEQATSSSPLGFVMAARWRGRKYLFSPLMDFLLAGGAAFAALLAVMLLLPPGTAPDPALIGFIFAAGIFINAPHGLYSLMLLYEKLPSAWRNRALEPAQARRYIVAGIVTPLVLGAYLLSAIVLTSRQMLDLANILMLFMVGWHYVKQGYGVWVHLSVIKGIRYTQFERDAMKFNANIAWLAGWVDFITSSGIWKNSTQQDPYAFAPLAWALNANLPLAIVCISVCIASMILCHAHLRQKVRPSASALAGYATVYVLYGFQYMVNPLWVFISPLFHGLQYIMFVCAYKKGQAATMRDQLDANPVKIRIWFYTYLIGGLIGSWLLLTYLPSLMDSTLSHDPALFGYGLYTFLIVNLTNIMHYMADSVVWRKENREVATYLHR